MNKRISSLCLSVVLIVVIGMTSCSEGMPTGNLNVQFPGVSATDRSILPDSTKITWIKLSGYRNDDNSIVVGDQSFQLGEAISIKGLSVGSWTFSVTGYSGDPDVSGSVLLTKVASDTNVMIQSGKTTTAVFVLHYLTEGKGSATVETTWPSTVPVRITGSLSDGTTSYDPSTSTSNEGVAALTFSDLDVGDYDLALTAVNPSGKTIAFPMIDMVNIFSSLTSSGSIALEQADFPSVAVPSISAGDTFTSTTATPYAYRLITIESTESNADIYYTTDGNVPGFTSTEAPNASTKKYEEPFEIIAQNEAADTTIRAIAVCNGYVDSQEVSELFTVNGLGDSGLVITDPSLISEVAISQSTNDQMTFSVDYASKGTPNEEITWYVDTKDTIASDIDGDENPKTITFATLDSGRHQIMVNILYYDGEEVKTAYASLRCTIE